MIDFTADSFFESKDLSQYKVSIQISLDGFSFLVVGQSNEIIVAKKSAAKISSPGLLAYHFNDWVQTEPLLKLPFKKVTLLIFEESFTLIPDSFGDQSVQKIDEIMLRDEKEHVLVTNPAGDNILIRFAILKELMQLAEKKFTETEWIHPVAILLNHLPESDKPNLSFLIRSQNRYFFIVKQRSKLLLANCFVANHTSDLVYHVINTFQQLKVARTQTQLMISDTGENLRNTIETLASYFPTIEVFPAENKRIKEVNLFHTYLATL